MTVINRSWFVLMGSMVLLAGCQLASHRAMMGCPTPEPETRQPEPGEAMVMLLEGELCASDCVFRRGTRVELEHYAPETLQRMDFGQSLTLNDITNLSALGFCDEMVFYQIERTDTQFALTPQDVIQLEMSGVRPSIIAYLKKRFEDKWFNPYGPRFPGAQNAPEDELTTS
jgi:hypothetical protein